MGRGPYNIGGRTKALAIYIENENTILAGGVSSGMWKSIDGGVLWVKTTAPDQLHSVSCVAQNKYPGKDNIWYYGTGSGTSGSGGSAAIPAGSSYKGDGIFKSIDGETWQNISHSNWPDSTVRTVIGIAPSNEKIVYFFTCQKHWKTPLWKYEEGVGWTNLTENVPFNGEMTTYGGNMLIIYVKPMVFTAHILKNRRQVWNKLQLEQRVFIFFMLIRIRLICQ